MKRKNSVKPIQDELFVYGREAAKHKLLTKSEEFILATRTKGVGEAAEKAKEEMFLHNMRLVITIAKGFRKSGTTVGDLVQEASIGLMRAIEKFDPDKGFKFSTYASWWIRQAIFKTMYLSPAIRVPFDLMAKKRRFEKAIRENPDLNAEDLCKKAEITAQDLSRIRAIPEAVIRLEDPSFEGESSSPTLKDSVEDPSINPEESIIYKELLEIIGGIISSIPERDRSIFLDTVLLEETLSESGKKNGISRERVRQIATCTANSIRAKYLKDHG